jgi:antitoxin component of MazEF toxin-antitoxin module
MVEVKLQKRISKQGKNNYFIYVITLPKIIVEALNLTKCKKLNVKIEKGKIVLGEKK